MIVFDAFKQVLLTATQDQDFIRKNTLMQEAAFVSDVNTRIQALTPHVNFSLSTNEVESVVGALSLNQTQRTIVFDPAGAGFLLSNYREGTIESPGKLSNTVPDLAAAYLLADVDQGVLLLDEQLNVKRVFPNYDPLGVAGDAYSSPTHAIAFNKGGVDYVAIAMATHHIVRVYNAATGVVESTLGTPDTAGVPPGGGLDTPMALSWDGTNLYIACAAGQPLGATAANGYIAMWLWQFGPLAIFNELFYKTNGSLVRNEVTAPKALVLDSGLLWIVNGNDEIGGFPVGTSGTLEFIPSKTTEYALSGVNDIKIRTLYDTDGVPNKLLYIANSDYGNVVALTLQDHKLHRVFGTRATEDTSLSQASAFFGNAGSVDGILPGSDVVSEALTLVISDSTNKRLQRLDEGAYSADNQCTFKQLTFAVPLTIKGWAIAGDIPIEMVLVEFRLNDTDDWHVLEQCSSVPPTIQLQLRIIASLPPDRVIKSWSIRQLTILAEQA